MKREQSGHFETTLFGEEAVRAFVPAPLPPNPSIDLAALAQPLEEAAGAIGALDAITAHLPDPDLLIYSYIRREAQLSSEIEGTQSSFSDLLEFELTGTPGALIDDVTEVSNYVAALSHGVRRIRVDDFPISNRLIRELHERLLQSGRGSEKQPGEFRRSQNWIGGRRPGTAMYVPPPHLAVEDCMSGLERFIHSTDDGLPALVRAGLAHAQFESIHPFLDGNGRVGRMLIPFILMQAGTLSEPILYLSLYFKQFRSTYYDLLNQLRDFGDWEAWLTFFLEGVVMTARHGVSTAAQLRSQFDDDRRQIQATGRRASSALRAHEAFIRRPLLSIAAVADHADISPSAAAAAVRHLESLGVVNEITGRRRDRLFVYRSYLDILNRGLDLFGQPAVYDEGAYYAVPD